MVKSNLDMLMKERFVTKWLTKENHVYMVNQIKQAKSVIAT